MESFAIYTELFLFDFLTFFELMEQDYKDYKKLAHEPIYALATYTSTTLQIQRVAKNYKNLFYLEPNDSSQDVSSWNFLHNSGTVAERIEAMWQ